MQYLPSPRDLFMMFVSIGVHVGNISLRMVVGMGSSLQCFAFIPMTMADTTICVIGANLDSSGIEFSAGWIGRISTKNFLIFSTFDENSLQMTLPILDHSCPLALG